MSVMLEPSVQTNQVEEKKLLDKRWQLWYWKVDNGKSMSAWQDSLNKLSSFSTIEQFWKVYHDMEGIRFRSSPCDYYVFKEGIIPMWEDENNIKGGRWSLEFPKGTRGERNPNLDEVWRNLLLTLIGNGFNEYGEEICGAVINIRSKVDRISLWTAEADHTVAKLNIGYILKDRTGFRGPIKYEAHSSTQKKAKARVESRMNIKKYQKI